MAVTLTTDDLIAPAGRLQPAMFPDGDINANVVAWLSEATTKVAADEIESDDHDAAAEAWVYHRAYDFVAERMLAEPEQYTTEDGESRRLTMAQITRFQALAQHYKTAYEAYDVDAVVHEQPASTSVSVRASW